MADLGIVESESPMDISKAESKEPRYPDLTLRDEQVERVKGDHQCTPGDEYTATVRLRVSGVKDDEYGSSLSFQVLSMDEFTPAEGGAEYDEEVEEDEPEEKTAKGKQQPSKALTYAAPSAP